MSDSSQVDFRSLLKLNSTQVERPKLLPDGHYFGRIGAHTFGKSSQKQTPYVRFMLHAEQASDDVDQEALEGIDLSRRELRSDFYLTHAALSRLSDMLDGVIGNPERSIEERIPETRGVYVLFGVGHRSNEAGTQSFNDVTTIVRATEGQAAEEEEAAAAA
jgi:hypothetical protein